MSAAAHIWSERWRLAILTRDEFIRIALGAVMIGMLFVLFHLQGNTTDVRKWGYSALYWMVDRWSDAFASTADYSHGWLIPIVSIGIIWYKRKELMQAPKSLSRWGLAVIVIALLTHWLGAKAQQTRLSLFGLALLLWGIPFYLYGWNVARVLIFPCSYLFLCIPLNFLDSLTFPLRIFSTIVSTSVLNGLGIAAQRSGSAIYSMAAGGFSFDVADPCSGIRSLIAMMALTAVYAYLTQKTLIRKWLLFFSCIPLAIIGNIARIVTVALVAQSFGEKAALGLYHDYSGYVIFSVAIGLMVGLGSLLSLNFRKEWIQWKHTLLNPISS